MLCSNGIFAINKLGSTEKKIEDFGYSQVVWFFFFFPAINKPESTEKIKFWGFAYGEVIC